MDRPESPAAVDGEVTTDQEVPMKQQDFAADRLASEMASLQQSSTAQPDAETIAATEAAETFQAAPEPEQATEQSVIEQPGKSSTAAEADYDAERAYQPPPVSKVSTILLPAITGAVAAVLVAGAAFNGMIPGLMPPSVATAPLSESAALNALATRVATIESRPASASLPTAAAVATATSDPGLALRVESLEKAIASLRDDLTAARGQSEQFASAIGALKLATAETTSAAPAAPPTDRGSDLAAINGRLDQLERAASAAKETAEKPVEKTPEPAPVAAPVDDVPLRRVVAATLLDLAVRNGEPYAAILESAKPLAADAAALASLNAFAASGVPSAAALSRELVPLLPNLLPPAQTPGSAANFVDRLQANAERLVKIQRADAIAGIDRTAIVSRTAAAAQRNDLAAARDELNALAPADRKPVQSWIDKVEARDRALAASRQFAAAALAALPKTSP